MLAVINLFIYILKIPTLETVGSDLALLDLAAGHFAKVHFLTSSQVSFTFAREIVTLANRTVRIATMAAPRGTTNRSSTYSPDLLPVNISGEPVSLYLVRLPMILVRVLIPILCFPGFGICLKCRFRGIEYSLDRVLRKPFGCRGHDHLLNRRIVYLSCNLKWTYQVTFISENPSLSIVL